MRSNLLRIFGLLAAALAFTLVVSGEPVRALIDPPTTGRVNDIPAPPSVCVDEAVYGTIIAAFNEKQHVRLPGPGNVAAQAPSPKYGGSAMYDEVSDLNQTFAILPNSVVNSHFLHRQRLNPDDPSNPSLGTVSFDSDIIAVILSVGGLDSTDVLLGAGSPPPSCGSCPPSATCYPTDVSNRALELEATDDYVRYLGARTLEVQFDTTNVIDAIRVITEGNRAPLAGDDTFPGTEEVQTTGSVLGNDSDPDGAALTATLTTNSTNGNTVVQPNGSFTYTPSTNFFGADTFVYRVCDPPTATPTLTLPGLCDTAQVTLNVAGVNDPPTAAPDTLTVAEDTPWFVDVLMNDTDGPANENQTLTITSVSNPPNGQAFHVNLGNIEYDVDSNYNGPDSFNYTVCDNGVPSLCTSSSVSVTVTPVNDAPVAVADAATITGPVATVIDLRANDSKGPANESAQTLAVTSVTQPAHGVASIIPSGPDAGKVLVTALPGDCPTSHPQWVAPAVDTDADCVDDTIEAAVSTDGVAGPYVYYDDAPVMFSYTVCDNGVPSLCDTETVAVTFEDDIDTDGDGCSDLEEVLNDVNFGGQRHPGNWWDFLDVSGDGVVDVTDASLALEHFGHGPSDDAPDQTFDRMWTAGGELGGRFIVVEGHDGIDLTEAIIALGQFGAECSPPGPTPAPGGGIY